MSSDSPRTVRVTRETGRVAVNRRTYRSGDFTHILFGSLATIMGLLLLWIAVANGTLFDGAATPAVIAALLGYGYFALTRITNSRTVTIADGRIAAKDGPLPQFVRTVNASIDEYGTVETRSAMRLTFPPTHRYRLWYVGARESTDLFRRLPDEDEARFIQAVVVSALRTNHD